MLGLRQVAEAAEVVFGVDCQEAAAGHELHVGGHALHAVPVMVGADKRPSGVSTWSSSDIHWAYFGAISEMVRRG